MPDSLAPHFHRDDGPTFSVVVPAFNEAEGLTAFHTRLAAAMAPLGAWEVIYVDDGSTDATRDVVDYLRRDDPRIAPVSL